MKARAAVQTAERTIQIQEFAVPDSVGPGEALLQVEGCGICGTDYDLYVNGPRRSGRVDYPYIPGHEPLGRIAMIGSQASRATGVKEGDRVAVESFVPCAVCRNCVEGRYQLCTHSFSYGFGQTTVPPALWGGFAEYLFLRPNTILHKIPEHLSTEDAALYNPMGAGYEWVCRAGGAQVGDVVLVLGPGQRGLACVIAAREAGASCIIVTGLSKDQHKLELAREFGATHAINVEQESIVERVLQITGRKGADRVVDTSPLATQPVADAIEAVRTSGTIVLAGIKSGRTAPIPVDKLIRKDIRLRGVVSVACWAYEQAIGMIAAGKYPLHKMHTHTLDIADLERGVRLIGGEVEGEQAIHVTIAPRESRSLPR